MTRFPLPIRELEARVYSRLPVHLKCALNCALKRPTVYGVQVVHQPAPPPTVEGLTEGGMVIGESAFGQTKMDIATWKEISRD